MNTQVENENEEVPVPQDVRQYREQVKAYCTAARCTPREAWRRTLEQAVKEGWSVKDFQADPMNGATWLERTLMLRTVAESEGIALPPLTQP